MQQDMKNSNDTQEMPQDQGNESPIDGIISRVQSYRDDPKLVTPQTMDDVLADLEDLITYLDKEETPGGEQSDESGPGLAIMIGHAKNGGTK